jgi:hypothetical protein
MSHRLRVRGVKQQQQQEELTAVGQAELARAGVWMEWRRKQVRERPGDDFDDE